MALNAGLQPSPVRRTRNCATFNPPNWSSNEQEAEASVDQAGGNATSAGATWSTDAADAETLLRHADRALYTAKANGRNRVEASFAPGLLDGPATDGHPGPT